MSVSLCSTLSKLKDDKQLINPSTVFFADGIIIFNQSVEAHFTLEIYVPVCIKVFVACSEFLALIIMDPTMTKIKFYSVVLP